MCNCIKETEELLTVKMQEEYPDWEVVENVEHQNKSYVFGGKVDIILKNPILGRVRKGKQIRKFERSIFPSYCPYCGEQLELKNS